MSIAEQEGPIGDDDAFQIPGIENGEFTEASASEIFQEFDIDNKGFITLSDVRRMMNNLNITVTDEELEFVMKQIDPEGSGGSTLEPFVDALVYPTPLFQNPHVDAGSNANLPIRRTRMVISKNPVEEVEAEYNRAANERRLLYVDLVSSGRLKASDIKKIFNRFETLDSRGKGRITYEQFLEGLQRPDSTSSRRMFDLCDKDGSGELDLREFVLGLCQLTDATQEDRIQFAFKLFDRDNSGYIDRDELTSIVKSASPAAILPAWIRKRVDELYESINLPKGALIDLPTFQVLAVKNPQVIAPVMDVKKN
jgi:serine/threonine-protein phosphatase 2B regulatory subunit